MSILVSRFQTLEIRDRITGGHKVKIGPNLLDIFEIEKVD